MVKSAIEYQKTLGSPVGITHGFNLEKPTDQHGFFINIDGHVHKAQLRLSPSERLQLLEALEPSMLELRKKMEEAKRLEEEAYGITEEVEVGPDGLLTEAQLKYAINKMLVTGRFRASMTQAQTQQLMKNFAMSQDYTEPTPVNTRRDSSGTLVPTDDASKACFEKLRLAKESDGGVIDFAPDFIGHKNWKLISFGVKAGSKGDTNQKL
ncbi:hypothetical protein MJO28_009493 [Puccinia striiformis f. sp. tritici]|uniref:Uncharacterized protein n=2 Tax=Puccinia striiformis TaxID=27350 RepID=A0A2S4UM37_9BASI|nr:hypothetical protein Pst134EB_018536 [Puccinia striiformis f. sp. tritici]KAI7947585.1 hypothetical protein MJO28_009493 [Puccinia striiformis f. sp. tritici]KAI9614981.1 hypothetical protein KEM48_005812 [Puccinia striiformis f. sp. tritici PST-130]POV98281.1 hypothetical protein PSTT_14523 [Puccinia striiformis]